MSCNNSIPLQTVADQVADLLSANYVDRDDPRIINGVFTAPSIRGGFLLDPTAKLAFCGFVQECGVIPPYGKAWIDLPAYPDKMLVSREELGETILQWQGINEVVEGTSAWAEVSNQAKYNVGIDSVADLPTDPTPTTGTRVHVKSYYTGAQKGGGFFTYDSAKSAINDNGLVINGWVREDTTNITPDDFGILGTGLVDVSAAFKAMLITCFTKKITVNTLLGTVYLIDDITLDGLSDFKFNCNGTLKRRDNLPTKGTVYNPANATSTLTLLNCKNVDIPIIRFDGNHINNHCRVTVPYNDEYNQEFRYGLVLTSCKDVNIGKFYGHRASGDSIFILGNDSKNINIDFLYADSLDDNGNYIALGRNPISILGGKHIRLGTVLIFGVGHSTMPGGLDIEPDNGRYVSDVVVDNIYCLSSGMNPLGIVSKYYNGDAIKNVHIKYAIVEAMPTTEPIRLVNFAGCTDVDIDYLKVIGTPSTYSIYAGISGTKQAVRGLRIKHAEVDTCGLGFTADNIYDSDINLIIKDGYTGLVRLYTSENVRVNLKKANFHAASVEAAKIYFRIYGTTGSMAKNITLSGDISKDIATIGTSHRAVVYGGTAANAKNITLKDLDLTGWWVVSSKVISGDTDFRVVNCKGLSEATPAMIATPAILRVAKGDYIKNSEPTVINDADGSYVVTGWTITESNDVVSNAPKVAHKEMVTAIKSGTTAQRPTGIAVGYQYFDSTLGKPIYFKSAGVWVDATGATV